jgi:hypothetical protein
MCKSFRISTSDSWLFDDVLTLQFCLVMMISASRREFVRDFRLCLRFDQVSRKCSRLLIVLELRAQFDSSSFSDSFPNQHLEFIRHHAKKASLHQVSREEPFEFLFADIQSVSFTTNLRLY